nr:uncharacterized protein LOC109982587 isoform X1 [Labrus bergylta]
MARNSEKQQGRLNRLWLQREREEGRLREVPERRPRLSALNSASSVKKWIPSIKSEIEYYLQQSQLSHYPERKIAQFQQHIDSLEKEYKSFMSKLRVLDPTCKHSPWTPRAYHKRRADPSGTSSSVKTPRLSDSEGVSTDRRSEEGPDCNRPSDSDRAVTFLTNPLSGSSEGLSEDQNQDQPLLFDHMKLCVSAAAFRGPPSQLASSHTHSLTRVLQAGLPNLVNSSSSSNSRSRDSETQRNCGKSSVIETTDRTTHILGLDCYSSSSEEEEEESR